MKTIAILTVAFVSVILQHARAGAAECQDEALAIVKNILSQGNISVGLPADTTVGSKLVRDERGNAYETNEVNLGSSFGTVVSLRFLLEEDMCTLDLGALKIKSELPE